jgi:hypothetical protein
MPWLEPLGRRTVSASVFGPACLLRRRAGGGRFRERDQDIEHAEIAEPFATLTTPTLPDELDHLEQEPRHTPAQDSQDQATASNGHGSNKGQIVEKGSAEPPRLGLTASWSRHLHMI